MSYSSTAKLAADSDFLARVNACVIVEHGKHPSDQWVAQHHWDVAGFGTLAEQYALALIDPKATRPGDDPNVISDEEIDEAVTAVMFPPPTGEYLITYGHDGPSYELLIKNLDFSDVVGQLVDWQFGDGKSQLGVDSMTPGTYVYKPGTYTVKATIAGIYVANTEITVE